MTAPLSMILSTILTFGYIAQSLPYNCLPLKMDIGVHNSLFPYLSTGRYKNRILIDKITPLSANLLSIRSFIMRPAFQALHGY